MKRPDTPQSAEATAVAFGPASLSNLGPGFDTLGLCLGEMGDVVEASLSRRPGVRVHVAPGVVNAPIPTDPHKNTAARAASVVLQQASESRGLTLRISKGIPLGSGIGGSAASAAAGAWAANGALGYPFAREELVEAVLEGEALASGARHGDNALPSLFGGLVLTSPVDPTDYSRIQISGAPAIVVVLPNIQILTSEARSILPPEVPFRDAIHNASDLAFMVQAFRDADWRSVGRFMMRDRLVEPVRARLIPCYEQVKKAAMEAGAFGCALTGSGPAMFAITENTNSGAEVLEAMTAACQSEGVDASGMVSFVDVEGVRTLPQDQSGA